jgi:hypothetical protein
MPSIPGPPEQRSIVRTVPTPIPSILMEIKCLSCRGLQLTGAGVFGDNLGLLARYADSSRLPPTRSPAMSVGGFFRSVSPATCSSADLYHFRHNARIVSEIMERHLWFPAVYDPESIGHKRARGRNQREIRACDRYRQNAFRDNSTPRRSSSRD